MVSTPVFSLIRMIACGIPAIFIFEPGHYEGHHGIYLCELDKETFQFKGKRKVIWDGEKTRSKWIEAPHIYFENGWYYLMVAEGGTFTNHCVMMHAAALLTAITKYVPAILS